MRLGRPAEPGLDSFVGRIRDNGRRECLARDPCTFHHKLIDRAGVAVFSFRSGKHGLIHKTVVFFVGETTATEVVLSDEHVGAAFLPYDAAMARLTYATARELLKSAHEFLDSTAAGAAAASR